MREVHELKEHEPQPSCLDQASCSRHVITLLLYELPLLRCAPIYICTFLRQSKKPRMSQRRSLHARTCGPHTPSTPTHPQLPWPSQSQDSFTPRRTSCSRPSRSARDILVRFPHDLTCPYTHISPVPRRTWHVHLPLHPLHLHTHQWHNSILSPPCARRPCACPWPL